MTTCLQTGEQHVFYGLGCEGAPEDLGYGHNGAHPAFRTVMRYLPSGAVVVMFANYLDYSFVFSEGQVMYAILREAMEIIGDK